MTKTPTIQDVRNEVKRMDPNVQESDEAFRAAVVLLALLTIEPADWRPRKIAALTGYGERDVSRWLKRLRAARIIQGRQLAVEWFEKGSGGIAFWLDVNVALGLIQRA